MDWASKYRPSRLSELVGNGPAVRQIYEWGTAWTIGKKPLLLYGKPGTGKTSSAYALAAELGWDVIELNASDQRTKAVIERVAGNASTTGTLFGAARKLILIDEADNLQGTADRGGAKAIVDLIRGSRQPIILIANDLYGISPGIRDECEPVQFRAVQARSIVPRLKYICASEHVVCSPEALAGIAENASGDIRSAINMLYASAQGRTSIDARDVLAASKDERSTIFSLVSSLFSNLPDSELMKMSYDLDETPDTVEQWIEANLGHIRDEKEYSRAYAALSRADEYIGYTYRQQYYTLWRYATSLMVLGVADAAGGRGLHARVNSPERWRRMARTRGVRGIRTGLFTRLAEPLHATGHTLRSEYFPLLSALVDSDPEGCARELTLSADELNLFLHDKTRSVSVAKKIAAERKDAERAERKPRKSPEKTKEPVTEKKGTDKPPEKPEPPPEKKAPPGPPEKQEQSPTPPPPERGTAKGQSTLF